MYQDRINHLRNICRTYNIDSYLISSSSNIFYFSGFGRFLQDHDGYLLVTPNSVFLITSPLYTEAVKKYTPELALLETSPDKWYTKHIKEIMDHENLKHLGFEESDLRTSEYFDLLDEKVDAVSVPLRYARIYKDNAELTAIQKACELTDKTFTDILSFLKPGVTELQVSEKMEHFMRENGGKAGFPTIVGSGPHAAVPHHMTSDEKLQKNSFVLLDYGGEIDRYMADMSRTVFLGTPTDEQRLMYETVRKAQQTAMEKIQDYLDKGEKQIPANVIDDVAREVIEQAGFPSYPHSLGHGIGLEVHEAPTLSRFAKDKLEDSMVFTIEPGIYLPGVGGVRIEDMYVIRDNKLLQLTHSPKDLIVL